MELLIGFKVTVLALGAGFIHYGMDVRRKAGARNLVRPVWLAIMKALSFSLIAAFLWLLLNAREIGPGDWLSLTLLVTGTCFVGAAKRALGAAHTFTGQCLEQPALVTGGVYGLTRNPLYLGVFQCELGALLFVSHHAPLVYPRSHALWLIAFVAALAYVVAFNLTMAVRESRILEDHFGDRYRRYRSRVPFLLPFTSPR